MKISKEKAKKVGDKLKIDWNKYSLDQFAKGLAVEQEHKDITKGNMVKTGKIAFAHLKEMPDYYTKLQNMEGSKNAKKEGKKASKRRK